MALIVPCPKCQNKHRLADDALVRALKFKCKKCGHVLTVAARKPAKVAPEIEEAEEAEEAEVAEEAEEVEAPAKKSGKKKGKNKRDDDEPRSKLPWIIGGGVAALVIVVGVLVFALSGGRNAQKQVALNSPPPITPDKKSRGDDKPSDGASDITKALGPTKEAAKPDEKSQAGGPLTLRNPPVDPVRVRLLGPVGSMVFSPKGDKAYVVCNGDADSQVLLTVEVPSGRMTVTPLNENVSTMAVRPEGQLVVSGLDQKSRHRELDPASGKLIRELATGSDYAQGLAVSPDGETLIVGERGTGGPNSVIRGIQLKTGVQTFSRGNTGADYARILIAPDGKAYALDKSPPGRVAILDAKTGDEKGNIPGAGAVDMALSADGKLIAIVHASARKVSIRNTANGQEQRSIDYGSATPVGVAFGPGDKSIVVGYRSAGVRVFEVENGNEVGGIEESITPAHLAVAPGGKYVAFSASPNLVILDFPGSLRKSSPATLPVEVVKNDPPPAPAQPTPAQPVPAQPVPAQPVPAQPTPGQLAPGQTSPGQLVPGGAPTQPVDPNQSQPWDPNRPWDAYRWGGLRLGVGRLWGNPFGVGLFPGQFGGQPPQPGQPPAEPLPPKISEAIKGKIEMHPAANQFVMKIQNKLEPFQTSPTTQFFDMAGTAVGVDQINKILRVGNTVSVKANLNDPQMAIVEVRLNAEGPREYKVLSAICKSPANNEWVGFTVDSESHLQYVRPDAKLESHAGKASKEGAKFFRVGGTYSYKIRAEEDSKVPELIEAKELKKFEWTDLQGGKIVKNAVVAQVKDDGIVTWYLLPTAGTKIRLSDASRKEAYAEDANGNRIPTADAFKPGNRVDALLIPRSATQHVVEIRVMAVPKAK